MVNELIYQQALYKINGENTARQQERSLYL